jgi:tRNA threonylcarbamoyladenosine biosynthesis protein TsaE
MGHVDAYRLGSASEIDDIDLENTLDSAVTVVEWGRDRVEHLTESRLEVELHRQLGGAAPAHLHAAGESTGPGTAAPGPGAPSPDVPVLDFESEDDDEPRTIIIRGFGPRWAEQPVLAAEGIS